MKEALSKIKYIFPAEKMQSNIAIFFSIFALFFAVGSSNVPCLNADTCSVGSDEVFSGTVTIQNNTNYGVKLTGNPTANRTITFPDADGTVKLAGATLTADKMLASDTNGEVAVTDKYPFTLGTAGQFLKVASTGLTMDFLTVGGLDSLTANAPYLSVNSSGAIDSSATLTASTPLKSNAQGQIAASDLDITTDITPGSALQEIRVNSGGTALEYYTPSGGSPDSRIVAQGSTVASSTYTGMEMICWYGQHTLDKDKNYKLIFNGGGYNIALSGDSNYWRPQQGDCTSGGGSYFSNILNYWLVGNGNLFGGNTYSTSSTFCRLVQSTNSNTSSAKTSNLSGEITLRPWRETNGYGFFANYDAMGVVYNAVNSPSQIQTAVGGCQDVNTNSFADITGLDMQLEGNGTSSGREWVLYEYDY